VTGRREAWLFWTLLALAVLTGAMGPLAAPRSGFTWDRVSNGLFFAVTGALLGWPAAWLVRRIKGPQRAGDVYWYALAGAVGAAILFLIMSFRG
jgi:drug/metabolite transporter (DMT)-like permease